MAKMISKTLLMTLVVPCFGSFSESASGQTMLGASRPAFKTRRTETKTAPAVKTASPSTTRRDPSPVSPVMTIAEIAAWQAALERAGYSPGLIDGIAGPKTETAIRTFQVVYEIPVTGRFDPVTRRALAIDLVPSTRRHVLTKAEQTLVGECPEDWIAKSKAKWLGFKSLASFSASLGHCSLKFLATLNPGVDLESLKPGDTVILPNVVRKEKWPKVATVEIDFGTKLVWAFDRSDKLVGLFHCSIAKEKQQRPSGVCKVANITVKPKYLFKPESWPEVKGVNQRLIIPPGPRNPVGLCWIGLSLKGYGIHGTPEPELIGKTGSHGCVRLTNWHVLQLAERLDVGAEVRFVDSAAKLAHRG